MLRYVARQPILTASEATFAYELLFRAGNENFARIDDPEAASRSVLADVITYGVGELARGRRVFLNCTREVLTEGLVTLIPKQEAVLEILETVSADEAFVRSCGELKAAGYKLALDDFVPNAGTLPLVPLADYIKLDFRQTSIDDCRAFTSAYRNKAEFIAEKVETRDDYMAASEMGCTLFQGYFFAQPSLISFHDLAPTKLSRVRLLAATCKPDFDFAEVESIIKEDVALSYKLLRYLNSAAFCLRSNITSLRQALVLLGEHAIRRWVCVSAAVAAGTGMASELVTTALLRARLCELLASSARCNPYRSFVVGLFSLLGMLFDVPMQYLLDHVELPAESREALLGQPGRLRQLFELVCAYIHGDWVSMVDRCGDLEVSLEWVTSCYVEAVKSVDLLMAME